MLEALLIATVVGLFSSWLRPIPMGIIITVLSLIEVATILRPASVLGFTGEFVLLLTVGEISYLLGLLLFMGLHLPRRFETALHSLRQ